MFLERNDWECDLIWNIWLPAAKVVPWSSEKSTADIKNCSLSICNRSFRICWRSCVLLLGMLDDLIGCGKWRQRCRRFGDHIAVLLRILPEYCAESAKTSTISFLHLTFSLDDEWTFPLHLLIVFPHPMSPLVKLFKRDSLAKHKNAKIAIEWRMYMKVFHTSPSEKSKSGVRRTNHMLVEMLRNVLLPLWIVSIQIVSDPHSFNELFAKDFADPFF